jgi:WD40 repeat protein
MLPSYTSGSSTSSSSHMYGLRFPCRSLCSLESSPSSSSPTCPEFLVGTFTCSDVNEVHLVSFDEDSQELKCNAIFEHREEIYSLSCSQQDSSLLSTISVKEEDERFHSRIWRMKSSPEESETSGRSKSTNSRSDGVSSLELVADFSSSSNRILRALFSPHDSDQFMSIQEDKCGFYSLNQQAIRNEFQLSSNSSSDSPSFVSGVFDPHHSQLFLSSDAWNLRLWDERTSNSPVQSLTNAHEGLIRTIDFNPNKPHQIVSAGEDSKINIWDLRKWKGTNGNNKAKYLRQLDQHTHWVWSVEFNRFHDQLLLSAGTELVNLWNVVSVSSAPLGELEVNPEHPNRHDKHEDQLIRTYSDHEESVYGAVWSRADAWTFASISYDGRLVLNNVPTKEKYKILL